MSLFDQQPMGPIPARRPVRYVPDPELEAAGIDPDHAEVEVLEPRPAELIDGVAKPARHRVRNLIAWLLLAPMLLSLILSIVSLAYPEGAGDRMLLPYLISAVIVVAVIGGAYLLFRRSLPTRQEP